MILFFLFYLLTHFSFHCEQCSNLLDIFHVSDRFRKWLFTVSRFLVCLAFAIAVALAYTLVKKQKLRQQQLARSILTDIPLQNRIDLEGKEYTPDQLARLGLSQYEIANYMQQLKEKRQRDLQRGIVTETTGVQKTTNVQSKEDLLDRNIIFSGLRELAGKSAASVENSIYTHTNVNRMSTSAGRAFYPMSTASTAGEIQLSGAQPAVNINYYDQDVITDSNQLHKFLNDFEQPSSQVAASPQNTLGIRSPIPQSGSTMYQPMSPYAIASPSPSIPQRPVSPGIKPPYKMQPRRYPPATGMERYSYGRYEPPPQLRGDILEEADIELNKRARQDLKELGIEQFQMNHWTDNMRRWISTNILNVLLKQIREINQYLKNNSNMKGYDCYNPLDRQPTMSHYIPAAIINNISQDEPLTLRSVLIALKNNTGNDPNGFQYISNRLYIEHYLRVPNCDRRYLIQRIEELASDTIMSKFLFNAGGNFEGKRWVDLNLPTDSDIIVYLFIKYFDLSLPEERPYGKTAFTLRHYIDQTTTKNDRSIRSGLYLVRARDYPPHFNVIYSNKVYECQFGRYNLFYAFTLFIWFVKKKLGNFLDSFDISGMGITTLISDI